MSVRPSLPALEGALRRSWQAAREHGALDSILPSMQTKQWQGMDGVHGYVTRDYAVMEAPDGLADVAAALAKSPLPTPPLSTPTLIEKYWAVRTLNGVQDPSWQPSLNVHVVVLRDGPITAEDVATTSELAKVLRSAAWQGAQAGFARPVPADERTPAPANLHVLALLLGTHVVKTVQRLVHDGWDHSIPVLAAAYRYAPADGFAFTRIGDDTFDAALSLERRTVEALGTALVSNDELPQLAWQWPGVNEAPVFVSDFWRSLHRADEA